MADMADGPPFLERQFRGISLDLGWRDGKGLAHGSTEWFEHRSVHVAAMNVSFSRHLQSQRIISRPSPVHPPPQLCAAHVTSWLFLNTVTCVPVSWLLLYFDI